MIKVKDWRKYQHFKYRRPSWIKLYASLLDSRAWGLLPDSPAKTLINVWLSASRTEGVLESFEKVAYITRTPVETLTEHMEILMASGNWFEEVPDPDPDEPQAIGSPEPPSRSPSQPSPSAPAEGSLNPTAGGSAFEKVYKKISQRHPRKADASEAAQ